MTDIDFENVTVDELATTMLDSLRIDLDAAKLEVDLDDTGIKFLLAMRKIAQEDPQVVADGFVALTIDLAAAEEALIGVDEMRAAFASMFEGLERNSEDPTEVN